MLTTVVLVENILLSVVKQTLLHFWMAYLLLGIIFLAVLLKRYWQIEKTSAPLSVEGCVVFATCWGNSAKQAGKKKKNFRGTSRLVQHYLFSHTTFASLFSL